MIRPPPRSPPFPSTTLFRSRRHRTLCMSGFSRAGVQATPGLGAHFSDPKSTRLNCRHPYISYSLFFFFNDPPPTEISPLPLHDALPISTTPNTLYVGVLARGCSSDPRTRRALLRSEEHTSELPSPLHLLFPLFFF